MYHSILQAFAAGGAICAIAVDAVAALLAYAVLRLPRRLAAAAAMAVVVASTSAGVIDFSPGLLRYVGEQWGRNAPGRLLDWQRQVKTAQVQTAGANQGFEQNLIEATNAFWNRTPYFDDPAHWGVPDYWATPVETLGSNGGDCEDYAFGKYFTLRELGIPARKLRITYVRAAGWDVSHMVLAYYPEVDADPLILDNLTGAILPASRRTDLEPVYSFNDDDLWTADASARKGRSSQIRLWRELLEKMAKEQRM